MNRLLPSCFNEKPYDNMHFQQVAVTSRMPYLEAFSPQDCNKYFINFKNYTIQVSEAEVFGR